MVDFAAMTLCVVSFVDTSGVRHRVEVQAGSLYEAAALAIRAFDGHGCPTGDSTALEVEIRTSITHTLTPRRLREWLQGSSKSPNDAVLKHRLRELLNIPGANSG